MAPIDIFELGDIFPRRVDVLAPGPNGKEHWSRLGPWVMAVNKAIEIPVDADAWMISDWWAVKTEWFAPADKAFDGVRIFSENLIGKRPADAAPADVSFRFLNGKSVTRPFGTAAYPPPLPDMFRPDGGVAATAVEAAARFGAKEIALCGVDMCDDKYFDGEISLSTECPHKGEWQWTPFFNSLIKWVKEQGVDIYSISPTALDVEVR